MNIAILGKSKINKPLTEELKANGFVPYEFESISQVDAVTGQIGDFKLKSEGREISAAGIVVVQSGQEDDARGYGLPLISLSDIEDPARVGDYKNPVVFVMDFPGESDVYSTCLALDMAARIAGKKKKVVYFAKSMKTASKEMEDKFREARNAGVTFIKYDKLSMEYEKEEGIFAVSAEDGYDSLSVRTKTVIVSDAAGSMDKNDKLPKMLRLKLNSKGFINSDKYFLFPTLTSRRGIYMLNEHTVVNDSDMKTYIKFTVSDMKNVLKNIGKNNAYAVVDQGKCAFCYTCYRACPHGAMAPDNENGAMKNLNDSCTACGICVSICPADAVRIVNKAEGIRKDPSKTLKVYCCKNSGEIAMRSVLKETGRDGAEKIDVEPVECGAELSAEKIAETLNHFEKVLVITCVDEACRHYDGSKRAGKYVDRVRQMLKASGQDESRVQLIKISHAMAGVAEEYITDMI